MRRWIVVLSMLVVGCGGSESSSSNPPAQAPSGNAAAPAPRPPAFPAADQFRLGEEAMLWVTGLDGPIECNKLYYKDAVVAIAQSFVHTGAEAIVRRCEGTSWANPSSPTSAELAAVGDEFSGSLAASYDNVVVDASGALGFEPLEMPDLYGVGSAWRGRLAYIAAHNPRERSGGGREADMVAIIYDISARMSFQEVLLGTCTLSAPGSDTVLAMSAPTWASDGRSVTFEGDEDQCSFGSVDVHPE
jgi:hypothetical protein